MNTTNFERTIKTHADRGEDYAAKGRKLNKRDRAKGRADKRAQGEAEE